MNEFLHILIIKAPEGERTLQEIDEILAEMRARRLALARVRKRIKSQARRTKKSLEKEKIEEIKKGKG